MLHESTVPTYNSGLTPYSQWQRSASVCTLHMKSVFEGLHSDRENISTFWCLFSQNTKSIRSFNDSFMYLKSTQNILNLFSVSFCVSLSGKTWTSLCDNIHSLYNNIYIKCLWCEILIVLQPFCASAPVWNLKSHTGSIPALFGLKFISGRYLL